jgi:hypothetical protein
MKYLPIKLCCSSFCKDVEELEEQDLLVLPAMQEAAAVAEAAPQSQY